MSTIALFDIDGTLIRAGGAGRRAVERALREFSGAPGDSTTLDGVDFAGRTDPWIVARGLQARGIAVDDPTIDAVLERYLALLPAELARSEAFEVLPGVVSLLDHLHGRADVTLGLGTGNVEEGAYAKLRHGGIDHYFSFGGFGCDHANRPTLLSKGRDRGLARHAIDDPIVIVVGDTPHDVTAAHAIGARCIAVCTGRHQAAALEAAGADLVVPDLLDSRVILEFTVRS
ncbi:MAG: HAD hydrolase-like protein [Myxococcota bacterium]